MKTNLSIWIPLPPHSKWRGEGIAQTIENIVNNLDDSINVEITVSQHHAQVLKEEFSDNLRVSIRQICFFGRREYVKQNKPSRRSSFSRLSLLKVGLKESGILESGFHKFIYGFIYKLKNFYYFVNLFLATVLQALNKKNSECVVWLPTPIILFSEKLRGKRMVSFWDPFVFEYLDFSDISPILLGRFYKIFNGASRIITQSNSNKDYLVGVLGVDPSSVHVIYNGTPDYSKYKDLYFKETSKDGRKLNILNRKKNISSIILDVINDSPIREYDDFIQSHTFASMNYRLHYRLKENSKIIMASTQFRPYKGVDTIFKIFDDLINRYPEIDFLFITTFRIPKHIRDRYTWYSNRNFEFLRVPNDVHAGLYMLSDLVLHPSYVEGGVGAYPQFEAASVGTPSIINSGRHANELLTISQFSAKFICDFDQVKRTSEIIYEILNSKDVADDCIENCNSVNISWSEQSRKYSSIISEL